MVPGDRLPLCEDVPDVAEVEMLVALGRLKELVVSCVSPVVTWLDDDDFDDDSNDCSVSIAEDAAVRAINIANLHLGAATAARIHWQQFSKRRASEKISKKQ
jgi:hypothetical protein